MEKPRQGDVLKRLVIVSMALLGSAVGGPEKTIGDQVRGTIIRVGNGSDFIGISLYVPTYRGGTEYTGYKIGVDKNLDTFEAGISWDESMMHSHRRMLTIGSNGLNIESE